MIPKFRAWDKDAAVMVYQENNGDDYVWMIGTQDIWVESLDDVGFDTPDQILMQSTGLKDKNGVEIFEGDVVVGQQHLTTDLSTPFEIKGLVKYSERNTMFYLDEKNVGHDKFMHSLGSSIYQYEVIGNIYENLELLEVESE
ncbi:DNA-packaging protein [Enterococcus hulanensis]|uniref:YopX family protein n=1 Tax=Enterococcus hulanensis TaxID=2559929 RepID=UPI001A8EF46A|nr:YopX family protein [Enterococcus hulanensis]MBO0459535.1 DNA-packaging protein [Enterococcus hulanensis]